MKITRDNYEIWFLDYLEGRLSEESMEEVRHFLIRYPDLANELEAFAPALTVGRKVSYPDKAKLKKDCYDDPSCFENAAVAAMEGDLDHEEALALQKWLAVNPDKLKYIQQFEATRLRPDLTITFTARESLKKKGFAFTRWMQLTSVAAILLLAFFLFSPGDRTIDDPVQTTARLNPLSQERPKDKNSDTDPKRIDLPGQAKPALAATQAPYKRMNRPETAAIVLPDTRPSEAIAMMTARYATLNSAGNPHPGLVTPGKEMRLAVASDDIPLSDFLEMKLQEMKENGSKGFITREELAMTGLHLFARLPGNRLRGKRGNDGRLTSVSLTTQLLAVSFPVNR
jgi:hypothetical protein